MNSFLYIYLHIGELNTQIWLGLEQNVADRMLLGISFVDHFIGDIVSFEQNDVPGNSRPVAIVTRKENRSGNPTIGNSEQEPPVNLQGPTKDEKHGIAHIDRAIELPPTTLNLVLVTTISDGLPTKEHKQFSANNHVVATAYGVMDVSPQRPFYIYLCTCATCLTIWLVYPNTW